MSISLANLNLNTTTFAAYADRLNLLTSYFGNVVITTSANSVGGSTSGNAFVTGIFGATTLVANNIAGGTVSSPANLNFTSNVIFTSNALFNSIVTVNNALNVNGAISSTTSNLVIHSGTIGAPTLNAAFVVSRGSSSNAQILWDETTTTWKVGVVGNLSSILTSAGSIDNANNSTNLNGQPASFYTNGANITGTVSNANNSTNLGGQPASFYTNGVNITNTVALANNSTNLAGQPGSYYTNGVNITGSVGNATQAANATNLNSQPGSFYTNASNLSTGTVPTARLGNVLNAIGANAVQNALNSTNLNGQPASFYTNASNITTGSLAAARLANPLSALILGNGLANTAGTLNLVAGSGLTVNSSGIFVTSIPNASTQVSSLGVGTPASGVAGEIRATNDITAFYSDKRLKENIESIKDALKKVNNLSGITFNSNKLAAEYGYTDTKKQVGVIAQEVKEVLPEAVVLAPFDTIHYNGKEYSKSGQNFLTVKYEKIVPLLIEAIKELNIKVDKLAAVT